MAELPDPTRRLRPLLEARAGRASVRVSGGGAMDAASRVDGATAGPLADRAGTERTDPTTTADPVVRSAAGWVPVWPTADTDRYGRARSDGPTEGRDADQDDADAVGGTGRGVGAGVVGTHRHRGGDRDAHTGRRSAGRRDDPWHRLAGGDADDDSGDDADEVSASSRRGGRHGRSPGRRPWARWRERWVPEGPGVRVDPGRRGSALLSVIAIGAVVAAALGMFGSGGTAVAPSAVAVVGGQTSAVWTATPAASSSISSVAPTAVPETAASGVASSATPTELIVAVTGAVARPGIVTVAPGARVADAIAAAGGVLDGTDYTGLNLAARVADGDSVVVGGSDQGLRSSGSTDDTSTSGGHAGGLVDLNAADPAALETLPGVGPVMAGNIIAWREANGGFTTVDQLQEITGIGPARFATLAPLVRVG